MTKPILPWHRRTARAIFELAYVYKAEIQNLVDCSQIAQIIVDNEPDRSELVEAAQTILADWKIPACPHGGEPWNCGSCEYEWGKRIAVAIERLRAALGKE